MTNTRLGCALFSALVALITSIGTAFAHTTSLGFVPGAAAGSVIIYSGSYAHGGTPVNEGVATLTGVTVTYNQSLPFNIPPVATKPAGLVDGTNNFFWGPANSMGVYPFPVSTDPVLFGGVVTWQGVTFTGLSPGTYTFTCGNSCGVTQQWQSLNTGANETVTIVLTSGSIGGGGAPPTTANIPTLSEWGLILLALIMGGVTFYTYRSTTRRR
ncbi:MAG TPA: IPTL-CTERM sorting domain-containing protein [Casimicrobiaceae bacterium]|nr:IPTL-CTERM sorting domain-containing protein [Casimicrobiaceae bacterium]